MKWLEEYERKLVYDTMNSDRIIKLLGGTTMGNLLDRIDEERMTNIEDYCNYIEFEVVELKVNKEGIRQTSKGFVYDVNIYIDAQGHQYYKRITLGYMTIASALELFGINQFNFKKVLKQMSDGVVSK